MDYYESDKNQAWAHRLLQEWIKISIDLENQNHIYLETPQFEVNNRVTQWGLYTHGEHPKISFSRSLVRDFGWGAVVLVLKHETAHYIVDKAWNMGDLAPHGAAFARACTILKIDAKRCTDVKELLNADNTVKVREKIVEKIRKLMALSESSARFEAENALRKAQDLMLKHNVTSLNDRTEGDYLFRPIGPIMGRIPVGVRTLANVMKDFYFVNHITHHYKTRKKYYEFFGTKENLDLAEYIFECLLRQGDILWQEYSVEVRAEYGSVKGKVSKAQFISGLYWGYRQKLEEQSQNRKSQRNIHGQSTELVWIGDPLMEEMYKDAYPRLVNVTHRSYARSGGYDEGFKRGKKLSVKRAIGSPSSDRRGILLNS